MKNQTLIALKFLLVMTVITGIFYPIIITVFSQLVFAKKANGSMITRNGIILGSELIGQKFDTTIYFWSRPSAVDYNPLPSGGSNLGPSSSKLKKQSDDRRINFINNNKCETFPKCFPFDIPKEMLFASASGLDPHISPKAALLQLDRIAKARNFNSVQKHQLEIIIHNLTESPQFFILGEQRINVFLLNLELDKIQ